MVLLKIYLGYRTTIRPPSPSTRIQHQPLFFSMGYAGAGKEMNVRPNISVTITMPDILDFLS